MIDIAQIQSADLTTNPLDACGATIGDFGCTIVGGYGIRLAVEIVAGGAVDVGVGFGCFVYRLILGELDGKIGG